MGRPPITGELTDGEGARAAVRAGRTALFITIGLTLLIIPATLGWYVDNQNRRMDADTAPALIFIGIGASAVATTLTQIDTSGLRAHRPGRPRGARQP